ncbi:MAG: ABC transporter permease [Candidatus Lambdaproteobacteria bacterium]|nr:ABC transporter permease [Candidatus Lambdaproteobacteria bacterium]
MIGELCRQEYVKLFTQKYPYVLLGGVLLVQVTRMLVRAFTPPETTLDVVTAPQLWAEGLGWGLRFGTYLILVVGAMAFSREFSLGTVKTVLVLPIRRRDWVLAKLLALIVLAWALLLAMAALGAALVALTSGWGPVVREGVVLYTEATVWREVVGATALTLVFLLPVCALALLLGLHFTSSGAAVGVTLLLGIGAEAAVGLAGWGKYVFLYHLHRPLELLEKLGKGMPYRWDQVLSWGLPTTLIAFAVLALWAVARLERLDIDG